MLNKLFHKQTKSKVEILCDFLYIFTINGFVNTRQIDRHNTETARQYDTRRRTNEPQADNMVYKVTDNLTHRKNMVQSLTLQDLLIDKAQHITLRTDFFKTFQTSFLQ